MEMIDASGLNGSVSRMKWRTLLNRYKEAMPGLPRTYQRESETTE